MPGPAPTISGEAALSPDAYEDDGAPLVLLREVATAPAARIAGAVPQSTELDDHEHGARQSRADPARPRP
ncbi:hypothetical protein ITI46_26335 [Streptomyces oryzae]|uniref:Uncharacterized protein n=1 Tax=Streptomyces oryzae TaxID=1434886 RepID=A0ABS3XIJ8_9ACTN|nr:hypothetical protein [Streptomyces oryzae]MBO8195143.1 hypothetical protein [Streptomyces oryzae]